MIVCVCNRVSDRDIAGAVREGCASFDELQAELRVGTKCGACRDCARDAFDTAVRATGIASMALQAIGVAVERRDCRLANAVA